MKRKSLGSSEERRKEHVESRQFTVPFNGSPDTCPYKVGELYEGREIVSIGFTENVYGHYYHLIVERGRAHLRMKFQFDESHDLKFSKPVERMTGPAPDISKYLEKAEINQTA